MYMEKHGPFSSSARLHVIEHKVCCATPHQEDIYRACKVVSINSVALSLVMLCVRSSSQPHTYQHAMQVCLQGGRTLLHVAAESSSQGGARQAEFAAIVQDLIHFGFSLTATNKVCSSSPWLAMSARKLSHAFQACK